MAWTDVQYAAHAAHAVDPSVLDAWTRYRRNDSTPLTTDQRGTGFARVSGGRIDVGAFERQVTLFPFTGFFQPVDNPGANDDVVNRAKAGTAIPVKFTLGGNQGLAIFRSGYPKFVSEPCDASDPQDDIEATTTSPAGLTYDAVTQQYTYVWKTDKSWAGRCARLELGLTDGSDHHALFRFVRRPAHHHDNPRPSGVRAILGAHLEPMANCFHGARGGRETAPRPR